MSDEIVNWLLENDNPAIKLRTQTELLGETADGAEAKAWIFGRLPASWHETNGLWYAYYITALAECSIKLDDIAPEQLQKAFEGLTLRFDCGCADLMLLRALVKLGCGTNETVTRTIEIAGERLLPDGGFLCRRRLDRLDYTPKSCYKANLQALLLAAECKKSGVGCPFTDSLTEYFWKRDIFYRTDDKSALVLNARPGWRTVDSFYPFEPMRVGLQNVVEAFSALGFGDDARLTRAWAMLNERRDETGRVILGGTLTKSYLPKERVGKPSKWATFYTLLAEKEKGDA